MRKTYVAIKVPINMSASWFVELKEAMRVNNIKVRWQNEHHHITAVFINAIPSDANYLLPLHTALAFKQGPELTIDKLDVFPATNDHIIHLTSSCPSEELTTMIQSIRDGIESIGCDYERDFRLHITLGRVAIQDADINRLKEILQHINMPSFTLQLMEAQFIALPNEEVCHFDFYRDWESAEVAHEERRRRAFRNANSNFQLFADPNM